ncbi:MAG: zinc ribbon domain-containing protein [Actinomycetota bacterium]
MSEGAVERRAEGGGPGGGITGETLAIRDSIVVIRQRFNYLTELWLAGELDVDRYVKELSRLVYCDSGGACWYISPHNGNWYRVTDTGQEPGEPPEFLYRPASDIAWEGVPAPQEPPAVRFCKHCGAPREDGAVFCSQCGRGFP